MRYAAEALRLLPYVAPPFVLAFALAAGLSLLVNRIERRRVLNPWLWGALAAASLLLLLVAFHFTTLYRLRGMEAH